MGALDAAAVTNLILASFPPYVVMPGPCKAQVRPRKKSVINKFSDRCEINQARGSSAEARQASGPSAAAGLSATARQASRLSVAARQARGQSAAPRQARGWRARARQFFYFVPLTGQKSSGKSC